MTDDDDFYENMIEDEDGISWPGGMRGMLSGKILEFCGCSNDEIIDDVIDVLKCFIHDENSYYTKIAEKLELDLKYVELILYVLDDKGLLEHGTAIRASWLTEKGKEIAKKYEEIFK